MDSEEIHKKYLKEACELAAKAVQNGGGPFAGIIVNEKGEVIASAHNKVVPNHDPSAHGEVETIREACKNIGSTNLSGCTLYSSSEPCPMCLGCCYWSNIKKIYYAISVEQSRKAGYHDELFYQEISKKKQNRSLPLIQIEIEGKFKGYQMFQEKIKKMAQSKE